MKFSRRAALIGGAFMLTGCAGSPLVDAPEGVQRISLPEPVQAPGLHEGQRLLMSLLLTVESEPEDQWRTSAVAQLGAQIERFASADPFGEPKAYFKRDAMPAVPLRESITRSVETLSVSSRKAENDSIKLLLLSAAAATHGLLNRTSIPSVGTEPSWVETLGGQRENALKHVWGMIAAVEQALGPRSSKDPLAQQLSARLSQLKILRGTLRAQFDEPPLQPAFFELPPLDSDAEVRASLAKMEVALAEALVLASAADGLDDALWKTQITAAQAAGGRLPRWPGWN